MFVKVFLFLSFALFLNTFGGNARSVSNEFQQEANHFLSRIIRNTQPVQCAKGAIGLFPHPYDCTKFLNCAPQTFVQSCGDGTAFNPSLKACDWPQNVNCNTADVQQPEQQPEQPPYVAVDDLTPYDDCDDSNSNMEQCYNRKMLDKAVQKYFRIDCSKSGQPHASLKRIIVFKDVLEKRFVKENRTTSTTRLPAHRGRVQNKSSHNQKLSTPSKKVSLTKSREVTISKMIGSSNRQETSSSSTSESSHQSGTNTNIENSDQKSKTKNEDYSVQHSNTYGSEHTNQNMNTNGWEVSASAGYSAFGFSAEFKAGVSGSESHTSSHTSTNSKTNGISLSSSDSNTATNVRTEGRGSSKSNTQSKGYTSSSVNARITESSTNDATSLRETVDEVVSFESQEITVRAEDEVEFQIEIHQYDVINDYHLDFEIDIDVPTQAFEFKRKEAICVISSNGQTIPLRRFLFIKRNYDKCCGKHFASITNDDIIFQHGKWIVRNIAATEKSTNYDLRMTINEVPKQE